MNTKKGKICELLRDLFPLYVDGLTGETSNHEIEKHLKTCKGCQQYYRDMTGELPEMCQTADIDEVELIKKLQKKQQKKKKIMIFSLIGILLVAVSFFVVEYQKVKSIELVIGSKLSDYDLVAYEDVELSYGKDDEGHYFKVKLKEKGSLYFTGSTRAMEDDMGNEIGEEGYFRIHKAIGNTAGSGETTIYSNADNLQGGVVKWTVVFKDRTVTIKNGEIVGEN